MSYLLILGRKDRNFVISAEKTSLKPERLLLLILSSLCPYVHSMPFLPSSLPPFCSVAVSSKRKNLLLQLLCRFKRVGLDFFSLKVHLQTSFQMQQSQSQKELFV